MNNEKKRENGQPDKEATEKNNTEEPGTPEEDITSYPLRDSSEDPRWAVRVVWTWVIIGLLLLTFIITLFILGFWFD